MPDPVLYYIRHGQTDWNAELRFQGRRDIPLNDIGRNQADENGKKLAGILGTGDDFRFVSSPLSRARETMHLVREAMGLPIEDYETDERLLEISYGDLEGITQMEMKKTNRSRYRYRKDNPWTFRPIGGESHRDVVARISDWYNDLDGQYIVTAHGAIGRVLRYHLLGLDSHTAARFPFPQDKILRISTKGEEFI